MQSVPPRAAFALLLLVGLATTGVAHANVSAFWRPLGTSASGSGVSQTPSPKRVLDASLAVGDNGRPVVAYTQYPNAASEQGAITVKRWTGAAWQTLSGAGGIGQGYQPQVRISSTGAIYVAWLTDDDDGHTEIRLRVRTTTTFGALGGSDSPGGISGTNPGLTGPFSLALDGNGNPIVAFIAAAQTGITDITADPALIDGTAQIYVRRWTGNSWEFVGSDFTGGGASNARSFVSNGDPIVHLADTPSLAIDGNGDPVVAFTYFTTVDNVPVANTDIYVTRWDGANWTEVGPAVPEGSTAAGTGGAGGVSDSDTGSFNPSLASDAAGRLALAWEEDTPTGATYIWLRVWNGVDTWEELAGSATGSGFTQAETLNMLPQIAVDADGNPIVAWQALADFAAPTQVFVLRWNGAGAWHEMPLLSDSASNAGISDAVLDAMAPALALTPPGGAAEPGVPTVAWLDSRDTGTFQIFLRQLFTGDTVPLTVTVIGDGTVTSNPIGVECATGTCVTEFPKGTVVTLVPQGGADTAFGAWAGACTGNGACTVSLTMPRSVNASFVAGATLTVDVVSEGGRVSSRPAGIASCTDSCSAKFAQGTMVTLTAAVNAGGTFTGWGDFCAFRGTNTTCAVPLGANTSATATFDLRRHRLAVVVAGTGGGLGFTTSDPSGIDCGGPDHTDCATDYDYGTTVRLTPFPDADSRLMSWTGCTRLNGSACDVRLTANRTVTARFGPARTLQVAASGNGSGSIVATTAPGLTCVSNCSVSQLFPFNASVVLTPRPALGTRFRWMAGGDNICAGTASCTAKMSANHSVVGEFSLNRHSLSVVSHPGGGVASLPPLPNGTIDCGNGSSACTGVFDYGTPVALHATPNEGFGFVNWTGVSCAGGATDTTCAFALRGNVTVRPNYRARTVVTVVKDGTGAGTITAPGVNCGADCSEAVFDGRTVTLRATATAGSRFLGFGDPCVAAGPTCTFVPEGNNQTVTATFQLVPYTLTVTQRASGGVANVNALADPVACGAGGTDCLTTLDFGTPVVLRATAIDGSAFLNWTGSVCNGLKTADCSFTVPARNISVAALFRDVTSLSLNKSGMGTVTSSPAGISCGPTCSAAAFDFARGALVRLTPRPAVGWSFDGFSGACSGPTCTVNASAVSASVGASFSIQSRWLNVTVAGNGSVSGSGFSCDPGATPCAQAFDYGTLLPLTPTPAEGHRFIGWSMGCTGAKPDTCRPLMTANRSVTATFRPVFGLEVDKTGNSNSGAITSSPAGINCGVTTADCSETYLGGTLVTLRRTAPVTGTVFRWLGDCAFRGTNATCALAMNANASVDAEYRLQPLGLSVNRIGPLFGSVSRVGGALDCGADCFEVIDYGTPVTLLATPSANPASEFESWTGCPTATGPSCSFPLTANRTVTATFRPLVTGVSLQSLLTGPLGVGGTRQITALATFTDGSVLDVTAQSTWSSNASTTATVNASGLVTARAVLGSAGVVATFRDLTSDPLVVEVDTLVADADVGAPRPRAIVVECSPYGESAVDASLLACLPSGRRFEVHCRATGRFAGDPDTDVDITDQVTWVSTSAAIARSTGLVALSGPVRQSFRMNAAGTARLYARLGGRTSLTTGTLGTDAWVVQGTPQTLTGPPEIQPATPSVQVGGDPVQLRAIATLSGTGACEDPRQRDFSLLVDWASENETVADVSFFGAVTGVAEGTAGISATYDIMEPVTVPIVVNP